MLVRGYSGKLLHAASMINFTHHLQNSCYLLLLLSRVIALPSVKYGGRVEMQM